MSMVDASVQELSHWIGTDTVTATGGVRKTVAGTTPDNVGIPAFVEQVTAARAKRIFGVNSEAGYRATVDEGWPILNKHFVRVDSGKYNGKILRVDDTFAVEGSDELELALVDTDARPDV